MALSPHSAASLAASTVVLSALALGTSSAGASSTSLSDPARDVKASSGASAAQKRTVDVTKVRYVVEDGRLVITTLLVDLRSTPGNQFVETEVRAGGTTFTLSSEIGKREVMVFTGSAYYPCRGARSGSSAARETVRQSVPLSCLDADSVTLRSSSTLARDNGSTIARDSVRGATVALR